MPSFEDDLRSRLIDIDLGDDPISTFCPEDLLIILCIHGCKHFWHRQIWITDLAALLTACPQLNWSHILSQATRLGALRMVCIGLSLAAQQPGTMLPPEINRRIEADPAVAACIKKMTPYFFESTGHTTLFDANAVFQPIYLSMRERTRDKMRYLWRVALTPGPGEWRLVSLPKALYPLYYLIRPLRLTGKYIRRVIMRLTTG